MGHHVLSNPVPEGSSFGSSEYDEIWRDAEEKTAVLLSQIQPSKRSEESRRGVINYIKSVLESKIYCKVFSFGSVPLKTYLPDGDIDLTAVSHPPKSDHEYQVWAERVCEILGREERIHVKEVKCIYAEVPVVKCLVENIIVDITFNQLGGLSTLCFLEEVDKLIGQDHLFKKSIILVKAWCFYESRILGAHHGLLSTYALEVLVLYIFHIYHHSLRGPLQVLYRFLHFFSKFDWEQYCLSPWDSVPPGLLQKAAEVPSPKSDGNFLLSKKFLGACREKYRTLLENNQGKTFTRKYMNLVDPLRPSNNLGRSVNSGNLVRIYSAFTYGAARLEKMLQSPKELTQENLVLFFRNTQKHCEGKRPDAGFLSLEGNTLCNKNSLTDHLTSNVMGSSNHMDDLKCRNANGAHADKPALDDALWQVDGPKQSNSDASWDETAISKNYKDNGRMCSLIDRENSWKSEVYSNEVNSFSSSVWSEPQLGDSLPSIKRSSVVDTDSQKDLSSPTSTPPLNSASLHLSETASVGSEDELPLHEQAVSLEGDFRGHFEFECRDTDAAILEGDYSTYLDNLSSGWAYQISFIHGDSHINPGGFALRCSARSGFSHSSRSKNVPIGTPCLPNGTILRSFPKNQKGTGTFFPNLITNFERDKRVFSNGVRSPRRNIDSLNSTNISTLSAFKSRANVPKRCDGPNKARCRKANDLKAGERESSTEDADMQRPTVDIADEFTISLERQVDSGAQRLTRGDWLRSPEAGIVPASHGNRGDWLRSPEAGIVPASHGNKDMSIPILEFGSFGPGFLASGSQSHLDHREHVEFASQTQHLSPHLESRDMASKAGSHTDQQKSIYHLKEEDFPPLSLVSPNTAGAGRAASSTQGSYHQACLLNYSGSAPKIA